MEKQSLDKKTLKKFISDNRLNETVENLIFQLNEFLDNNENHIDYRPIRNLFDALVINSGKLNGLEHDKIIGILDGETQRKTTAQIQNAVLYIIDHLPSQFWNYKRTTNKSSLKSQFVESVELMHQKQSEFEYDNKEQNGDNEKYRVFDVGYCVLHIVLNLSNNRIHKIFSNKRVIEKHLNYFNIKFDNIKFDNIEEVYYESIPHIYNELTSRVISHNSLYYYEFIVNSLTIFIAIMNSQTIDFKEFKVLFEKLEFDNNLKIEFYEIISRYERTNDSIIAEDLRVFINKLRETLSGFD